MRVAEIMEFADNVLCDAGIDETRNIDIQVLLGHCLQKTRTQLFLSGAEELSAEQEELFNGFLVRRIQREPLAYILGEQEFWSMNFNVSPDVLIPRPETEFLLECVLASKGAWRSSTSSILDLCTGSGVIATVLAKELRRPITAVDISPAALTIAASNIKRHNLTHLVFLIESNLFIGLPIEQKFGLVVSNPPYVESGEIAERLEPEVALYEPHLALDGGDDGLDLIRRIRIDLPQRLLIGGEVFMEFGAYQGKEIETIFSERGVDDSFFDKVQIFKDYAGRDRVVYARFAGYI